MTVPTRAQGQELETLLAACAAGDRNAFAALYKATSGRLFAVALNLLRRPELAEDILQESYVRIWASASSFSAARASALTWMGAIVRHACLDRLRGRELEFVDPPAEEGDYLDSFAALQPGPLERLQRNLDSTALAHCLEQLSEAVRESVVMAFIHGFTHAELARQLKQPLGTVKTHIRRGLAALKTCLQHRV